MFISLYQEYENEGTNTYVSELSVLFRRSPCQRCQISMSSGILYQGSPMKNSSLTPLLDRCAIDKFRGKKKKKRILFTHSNLLLWSIDVFYFRIKNECKYLFFFFFFRSFVGNTLEKALNKIGRDDIVKKCIFNVELITDDVEKAVARVRLDQPGFDSLKEELGPSRDTSLRRDATMDPKMNPDYDNFNKSKVCV